MANSVAEAVEQALQAQGTPDEGNPNVDDKKEAAAKENNQTADEQDENESDEDEESSKKELRVKQALDILDILEDPARNKQFVKMISSQFEDRIEGATTKKEVKDAAKELADELKELVGEEDQHLLKPIMAVVQRLLGETEKKFLGTLEQIENRRVKADLETRYQDFIEKNDVTKEEQKLMQELVVEFPPNPNVPFGRYMTHLRNLAKVQITEKTAKANRNQKIEENKTRTKYQNAGANRDGEGNNRPIIKTPLDAVMAAVAELQGQKD